MIRSEIFFLFGFDDGDIIRIHMPIRTNDQVVFVEPLPNEGGSGYQVGDKVDFDKFIKTCNLVLQRRNSQLHDSELKLLKYLYKKMI